MFIQKPAFRLEDYIGTGKRLHFIAVGGVHMSAIAELLREKGCVVTGSDKNDGPNVQRLREAGMDVKLGHKAEYVDGADAIVRNAAIKEDFPDMVEARRLGLPVFDRPQVLGAIMRGYSERVCVSGTHGKSTTTSMCAEIASAAGLSPTTFCGAELPETGRAYSFGTGDLFIAEACEYCESFLQFYPTTAVVLNVEADHLDYYTGGIEQIKSSFARFASLVGASGRVVVNGDDKNAMESARRSGSKLVTFGIDGDYDFTARNISFDGGFPTFDVMRGGEKLFTLRLAIPGRHNIMNALAATAVCVPLGVDPELVRGTLAAFTGALRRFQRMGECGGAQVVDDYAHHPTELAATLRAARDVCGSGKLIVVFQPHTYSRMLALKEDFIKSLGLADKAILAPVYAAREINPGVTSRVLSDEVENAEYVEGFEAIAERVRDLVGPGDLVITAGAGDIYKVARLLAK